MSSWHKETNVHSDFILSVQSEDLGTMIMTGLPDFVQAYESALKSRKQVLYKARE